MEHELTERHLGHQRIMALCGADEVRDGLVGPDQATYDNLVFWLATLGWTPQAFLEEAYPEIGC